MLAKRVIPVMLVKGRTLVKGQKFDSWRSIGHALQAAKVHAARGVDELCILDISATADGRGPDLDLVRELSEGCFIPITVGGGVRTLADIDALLRAGADKVAICTAARERPEFIEQAADRFGAQAITQVVEYDSYVEPGAHCVHVVSKFAGEIIMQCRDRDGTMEGYSLSFPCTVAREIEAPIVISGGCSGPQDMLDAFSAGMDACAAGALFAFSDFTPKACSRFLARAGLEMRV